MEKHSSQEIPLRLKHQMLQDAIEAIRCLHTGKKAEGERHLEHLKELSVHLNETIQQDVLIFAEQILFQYAYDPWHTISKDVEKAADRLIADL